MKFISRVEQDISRIGEANERDILVNTRILFIIQKNCPLPKKLPPKIALKNAESAIIVTCEITTKHVRLSFLSVAESSIKHYTLYNK